MFRISKFLNHYKNLSKPAKASLWFIACYIIQRGLQFIGMPIYTRIMNTEEYGIYSVFLSWFTLICVFTSLNIYSGTFNKAMVKYEKERDSYISSIQWLTFVISIIVCGFMTLFHNIVAEKTGFSLKLQLLMCIHVILFPSLQYWSQKQRFLFEYKKLVAVTLINSVASLLLGVIFVSISSEKSFALIAVTVVVQAVINSIIFFSLSEKGKTFYHNDYWKWSLCTAIPLLPHYISEIILGHADRLMINQMCGVSEAGIYNIVYQISMVMTIIRAGINGSFAPWLYYSLKEKKYQDIKKISELLTYLLAGMTILFMLIGPEILKIAAPSPYYDAAICIPSIMQGCFYIYVYVLFMYVEIYYEKTHGVAIASITAAIANLLLNYIFIPRFGYKAAAFTTMISYMLMAVLHYYFLMKIIKAEPEIVNVYNFKMIFFTSLFILIFGILILEIYEFPVIRYCLICLILLFAIHKRKRIADMISILKRRD